MNETEALLQQLRDIQTPWVSDVPAIGWWILLALCSLFLWLGKLLYKRYQRRGWLREAKMELALLRSQIGTVPVGQTLAAASRLIRRVVLTVRPREVVAGLEGEAWLEELDGICGSTHFRDGFGKLLEHGPYQPHHSVGEDDLNALMDVVAKLISSAGKMPMIRSGE